MTTGEPQYEPSEKDTLRMRMFIAQGGLCWICGGLMRLVRDEHPERATFDHVVPVARGGTWDEGNLKLAHKLCNNRRGDCSKPVLPERPRAARSDIRAMPFTGAWLRAKGYMRD